jgi:hypothetical protein
VRTLLSAFSTTASAARSRVMVFRMLATSLQDELARTHENAIVSSSRAIRFRDESKKRPPLSIMYDEQNVAYTEINSQISR